MACKQQGTCIFAEIVSMFVDTWLVFEGCTLPTVEAQISSI